MRLGKQSNFIEQAAITVRTTLHQCHSEDFIRQSDLLLADPLDQRANAEQTTILNTPARRSKRLHLIARAE